MTSPAAKDGLSETHDQELGTVFNAGECKDLVLLIANISEVMRKRVADTFDASIDAAKTGKQPLTKNPNITQPKGKDGKEKETEEEEKARKLREKREKELSAPKMLELKKDALEFFDRWREDVLKRVGTAVNKPKEEVEEQKEKATVEATPDTATAPEPKVLSKCEVQIVGCFMLRETIRICALLS